MSLRNGRRLLIIVLVFSAPALAFAQSMVPRFEVGPTFTCFSGCPSFKGDRGFGARGTFNITQFLGAEFQFTRLSQKSSIPNPTSYGSAHAKLTKRFEDRLKFNVFGIVGPGFTNRDEFIGNYFGGISKRFTRFAFNAGGGVEIVPTRIISARFDFTNLHSAKCGDGYCDTTINTNNFDFKFGAMFRLP
jgi:opacity protein-like surface antigen